MLRQNKNAAAKQKKPRQNKKATAKQKSSDKTKKTRQNKKAAANENLAAKKHVLTQSGVLSMNISQYLLQVFHYVRKIILQPLIIVSMSR